MEQPKMSQEGEANEEKLTLMDEYQEAISSDTERWVSVMESASTPAERRDIIKALITIGYAREAITDTETVLGELGTGDDHELRSREAIRNDKKMVNDLMAKYGLPLKY